MKKIFLSLIGIFVINACSSTNLPFNELEVNLNQKYGVITNEYYKMLENPIVEEDRKIILNKFENFRKEVRDLKLNRRKQSLNEITLLNSFINKSTINIQYLNDLGE
ncbi:MAG: hypothetical protein ACTTIS_06860 [Streptobacillus sp.]|uniref:hypothetical protein n=1 Tax=Fusobacterium nucleatum TaxID=851 RepID=UPI003CFD19AD